MGFSHFLKAIFPGGGACNGQMIDFVVFFYQNSRGLGGNIIERQWGRAEDFILLPENTGCKVRKEKKVAR